MSPNSLQTNGSPQADANPSSHLKEFESLARRYAEEKERRVRSDGMDQYVELEDSSKFAYLAEDPFVDHESLNARPSPLKNDQEVKVIILGAGHGGLLFAARLVEAGISPDDIRLVDIAVRTVVFPFATHGHCFDSVVGEICMARIHHSSNPRYAIASQSLTFPAKIRLRVDLGELGIGIATQASCATRKRRYTALSSRKRVICPKPNTPTERS